MWRKTAAQRAIDARKRIEQQYAPVYLYDEPTADLIFDGVQWRVIPTGYVQFKIQKVRTV